MKVLLVNTYSKGGAAKACIRLHKALLNAGIASKLLLLNKEANIPESISFKESNLIQESLRLKIKRKIHYLRHQRPINKRPESYDGFHSIKSIYDITMHPAYAWADIINLHWVTNFLDFESFFKKNTKPVIWTLHDMWPFSGGYHYEKGFPFEAYQSLIEKTISVKQKVLQKSNLQIVCPSLWLQKKSQESPTFRFFKHHHIPYSINPCLFHQFDLSKAREILGLPKEKKIILFVADSINNRRKGFSFMLDAFQQLSKDNDIALAVIGQYHGLPIDQDNIHFLGQIANEKFMHIGYTAADLFVISSIEDNLPNTILESLFCGIPVVGFNIGGIPEMIEEGLNGCLCPSITSEALTKTIQKALEKSFDPQAIRDQALAKYKPELQAARYTELFKQLLPNSPK